MASGSRRTTDAGLRHSRRYTDAALNGRLHPHAHGLLRAVKNKLNPRPQNLPEPAAKTRPGRRLLSGLNRASTPYALLTRSGCRRFAIAILVPDEAWRLLRRRSGRFSLLLSRMPEDSGLSLRCQGSRYLSGMRISCSVVSTTNMASSRAGFVELALALTLWWSPGISVQLSPAL